MGWTWSTNWLRYIFIYIYAQLTYISSQVAFEALENVKLHKEIKIKKGNLLHRGREVQGGREVQLVQADRGCHRYQGDQEDPADQCMGQTQGSHYKVSCDAIAATRRENIVPGWVTWPSALASIKTTPFTTSHFLPCLFLKMLTVQETALWSCDPAGSTSHVTHIRPGTGGGSWWGHLNLWAGESSFTQWKTESSTSEVIKC